MSRPRILFFSEALTSAHIFRPFQLAQDLYKKGYDVHFACTQQAAITNLCPELPFYQLKGSVTSESFLKELNKGRVPFTEKIILNNIQQDEQVIKKVKPNIVIDDMRLSLSITSEKQNLSHITLSNIIWSPFYKKDSEIIPEIDIFKIIGMRLGTRLFKLLKNRYENEIVKPFNIIRSKQKLPLVTSLSHLYCSGKSVGYFDIPELTPKIKLPDNHKFLGTLLFSYPTDKPHWWSSLNKNKPWIYVSLGSSGPQSICSKILKALSKTNEYEVIFSSSGHSFDGFPWSNVHWAQYLPDSEVLKHCSLYIGNGGSMSSHQALAAGVPIIAFPENYDQWLYSDLLKKNGVATIFRPSQFDINELQKATSRLTQHRPVCKEDPLPMKIRSANPSQSLIDMIEQDSQQKLKVA